ncbi:MAG: O-antigen ligase family protein [Rhodospirillales bacterium]
MMLRAPVNFQGRSVEALLGATACMAAGGVWLATGKPLAAAAAASAPLALAAVLSRPLVFVLGFLVFSFFRIHEVFPALYPLKIPLLLSLAALTSLVWDIWAGRVKPYWSRELSAFLFLFAAVALGALLAENRAAAWHALSSVYAKIAVMVFAIAWLTADKAAFKAVMRVVLAAGACVAAAALYNKFMGIGLVEGSRVTIGRDIGSMLGDPNDLSLVLLFPASFALAAVLNPGPGRLEKFAAAVVLALTLAAVIATQSRGGLLGFAAVAGVFAWTRVKSKALLITAGALGLAALFAAAGISDRASGGAAETGLGASAKGRLAAWDAALRMALANPLLGVGIDNFKLNYWEYVRIWDGRIRAVHSTWLGVLAETGVSGFTLFTVMFVLAMRRMRGALRYFSAAGPDHASARIMAEAVLGGLAGFAVSGAFLTMGFTWPVYILVALAAAAGRYMETAQERAASAGAP